MDHPNNPENQNTSCGSAISSSPEKEILGQLMKFIPTTSNEEANLALYLPLGEPENATKVQDWGPMPLAWW